MARGEVESLAAKWGLDTRSTAWLIKALDPFHDTSITVEGLPDTSAEPSYTFEVSKTVAISKPAGISTANWDCHIFNTPLVDGHPVQQGAQLDGGVWYTGNAAANLSLDFFNILCADAGSDTLPNQTNGITLAANDFVAGPDFSAFLDGPSRVVSCGWEVHNTTAQLEKQGTVTSYRQPTHPVVTSMFHYIGTNTAFTSSGGAMYIGPGWRCAMPPVNIDAAMLLPGTVQWEAADGTMLVVPFSSMENPLGASQTGEVYFADTDSDHAGNVGLISITKDPFGAFASKPAITVNTGSHVFGNGRVFRLAPLMQCGTYFTGLSSTTTLTATFKVTIEKAPDASQPTLAPLAKPSPLYSPQAFELYFRLVTQTKPAYPVSMNAGGDFWRGLLKAANTVAGIASVALPEFAPVITTGMGLANAIAHTVQERNKAKKKMKGKK